MSELLQQGCHCELNESPGAGFPRHSRMARRRADGRYVAYERTAQASGYE